MKMDGTPKQTITAFLIFTIFFSAAPVFAENIFESIARGVKAQFSGDSEIVDLGSNKFEITYHSRAAANSAEKHKNWNALAKKACKGNSYKVIDKRYRSAATIDQIMIGTVQCTGFATSIPGENVTKQQYDKTVILKAQKQLLALGYNIIADGVMGKQTQDAIQDFQLNRGVEVTGEPDIKTLQLLQQANNDFKEVVQENSDTPLKDKQNPQPVEHTDIVNKLKELHQLKQDGVITEEEFSRLKKKLIQ